jgi:hypothetical protein
MGAVTRASIRRRGRAGSAGRWRRRRARPAVRRVAAAAATRRCRRTRRPRPPRRCRAGPTKIRRCAAPRGTAARPPPRPPGRCPGVAQRDADPQRRGSERSGVAHGRSPCVRRSAQRMLDVRGFGAAVRDRISSNSFCAAIAGAGSRAAGVIQRPRTGRLALDHADNDELAATSSPPMGDGADHRARLCVLRSTPTVWSANSSGVGP